MSHSDARLTPRGRQILVERIPFGNSCRSRGQVHGRVKTVCSAKGGQISIREIRGSRGLLESFPPQPSAHGFSNRERHRVIASRPSRRSGALESRARCAPRIPSLGCWRAWASRVCVNATRSPAMTRRFDRASWCTLTSRSWARFPTAEAGAHGAARWARPQRVDAHVPVATTPTSWWTITHASPTPRSSLMRRRHLRGIPVARRSLFQRTRRVYRSRDDRQRL